jgi:hypothetical protein
MEEFFKAIKMLGEVKEIIPSIDISKEYKATRNSIFEAIATNIEKPVEIITINGDMFKFFPDGDVKIVSGISGDEYFLSGMDLEKIIEIMDIYGKEILDAVKTLSIISKVKSILNR